MKMLKGYENFSKSLNEFNVMNMNNLSDSSKKQNMNHIHAFDSLQLWDNEFHISAEWKVTPKSDAT